MSLGFCVGSALVVDINTNGVAAIEQQGFTARRLALGAVPSMDRTEVRDGDRDIDVLFLGGTTARRDAALAKLAPVLWDRHAEIRLFSSTRPIQGDEIGVVFGAAKYDLLARSKILVNLHRSDDSDGYFEWARMIETMANGCTVVTEPSRGYEPLRPGVHFVESDLPNLAQTVTDLLDDEDQRTEISAAATHAVLNGFPLSTAVAELLEHIESLPAEHPPESRRRRLRPQKPVQRTHQQPLLEAYAPFRSLRREVYDQLLAEMGHRRQLGSLRCLIEHGVDDYVDETTTSSYPSSAIPEVSVIVTLYNYADVVGETLSSIVASTEVDYEIVLVDDQSSDGGPDVVRAFMDAHPDVPIILLASAVNRGLPSSRNIAIGRCRADRIMVMDADNTVYPTCLRRLSDALDDNADAAFSYATLEAFGAEPGLRSARGWHVPWLCDGNYIDAQAMLRRTTWERHDGYRVADDVYGWEDWDLWLRLAVGGEHGVHVPQMLGRYRTQTDSMISVTNLVAADLRAGLVARYPTLPWPELTESE
jgi:hypothetical protein